MSNAREEARRMAEVMLAFADGADVQYRLQDDDPWHDTGVPDWDWDLWNYRVKPKPPREEWQVIDSVGRVLGTYATAAAAAQSVPDEYRVSVPSSAAFRIVHMREVSP